MNRLLVLVFLMVSSLGFSRDTGPKIGEPDPVQLNTVIVASIVLVGTLAAAPYAIAYSGSVQIESIRVPYWAIDLAAALAALAALNYTWNDLNHGRDDRTSVKVLGFPVGHF